jgi:hypothetical protein
MRTTVLGALAALTLALTACGGGQEAPGVASVNGTATTPGVGAPPSVDRSEMGLKFAQCMRENGVNVPDPEPGGGVQFRVDGRTSKETVDKAQQACKEFAPGGGDRGGPEDAKRAESMRKLAQCMRDKGVPDFPDPDGGAIRMTKEVADDPDFPAAQKECAAAFMPKMGKGGS